MHPLLSCIPVTAFSEPHRFSSFCVHCIRLCTGVRVEEDLPLRLCLFCCRGFWTVRTACMRFVSLLGCCWVWARLGVFFGWPPAGLKEGGGLYGMMAEVEGSGMLTAMFGCWGRAQARAIRLCVQQGPAAAGTSSSCRHGPVLSGACGGRAVRNVWQRYIQEPPEQGTACAWSPAATATSCALVECLVRCLAAPLPLRV